MGFNDLQAFNDALLAKQLWRILTKPNCLMSKVLKQKYLPKCDIFQAKVPVQASWLWRSWASARYLLREGCRWRVGDGKSISVWEDSWLIANHMRKPISPKPEGSGVVKVFDLRNSAGEGWNM